MSQRIALLLLIVGLLAACANPTPPQPTPELVVPTATESAAPTTETLPDGATPTTTAAETATPAPLIPTRVSPVRIEFPAGGTSAAVSGSLAARGSAEYILRAFAGQTMRVAVSSPGGMIVPSIQGADGALLKLSIDGLTEWAGTLPSAQEYIIRLTALGSADSYTLAVDIDPPAVPEPAPERIEFPAGGTSATRSGTVQPTSVNRYVLGAAAGQRMDVRVTAADPNVLLAVIGADGIPLQRYIAGAVDFAGILPVTQDYVLEVWSFSAAPQAYTLDVSIPAEAPPPTAPPPTAAAPTRIEFAPGAITGSVAVTPTPGATDRYVLGAGRGQLMFISLSSTGAPAFRVGPAGQPHFDERLIRWAGELPATGDYAISVIDDGTGAPYTLTVTIVTPESADSAERIAFAPGASAATVSATLNVAADTYRSHRYVVRALAGQTLQLTLNGVPGGFTVVTVFGADGARLGGLDNALGSSVTVPLPSTQDYTISLIAAGGAGGLSLNYDLTVAIP